MADEPERKPPTMRELAEMMTPPGIGFGRLWDSLKGAQVGPPPDFSRPTPEFEAEPAAAPSLRICPYCHRPHAADLGCITVSAASAPRRYEYPVGVAPLPPLDPFTPGAEASAALAEMYADMCTSGIPVASVESILGHMLAAYQLGKDEAGRA